MYESLKETVKLAIDTNSIVPALSASLEYIKAVAMDDPTNFEEAQLDAFGDHCFSFISDKAGHPKKGDHHVGMLKGSFCLFHERCLTLLLSLRVEEGLEVGPFRVHDVCSCHTCSLFSCCIAIARLACCLPCSRTTAHACHAGQRDAKIPNYLLKGTVASILHALPE